MNASGAILENQTNSCRVRFRCIWNGSVQTGWNGDRFGENKSGNITLKGKCPEGASVHIEVAVEGGPNLYSDPFTFNEGANEIYYTVYGELDNNILEGPSVNANVATN